MNYQLIKLQGDERISAELEAYHKFKQEKENSDVLYLVDQGWIQSWINYLGGKGKADEEKPKSPSYI